jgi:hypothetical protein
MNDSELEKCTLLDYYAVSSGNFLPALQDRLSIPSSLFKNPKESPNVEFM